MSQFDDGSLLLPLVSGWLSKINQAKKSKTAFNEVAEQCMAFFSGAQGFMWDEKYRSKFLKGAISPKFRMTMSKAFELVALYGPSLYWRNPQRMIKPRKGLDLSPELFGFDENAQMMFQQAQQEEAFRGAQDRCRAQLFERYLNYTPHEQPGGGLELHASKAITEALIKGRGCVWVKPYRMPGSQTTMTGCFYDTVDNLLIDPDAEDIHTAKWIAQRCCHPIWEVEREYNLPPDTLDGKGAMESADRQGEMAQEEMRNLKREAGKTFDLMVYYKIWSRGGVGSRLSGVKDEFQQHFDDVVGDYAYIVVAPGVKHPLNCHPDAMFTEGDQEIGKKFEWPVPYWLDDKWPVAVLDFYEKPRDAWPIAPLAPGLGELSFINIIVSHLANRIWSSTRDFIAVLQSAAKDFEDSLKSGEDQTIIKVKAVHKDLREVIQFIQQPPTNVDAWHILDKISEIFDKRVGLSELLYGATAGISRTATDASARHQQVSIRPDYMAGRVESWMESCADMEKLCARWYVPAETIRPLLGNVGAYLWNQLVENADPELVVREMEATVAAGSTRKPNKDRDSANIAQVMPALIPVLSQYAGATTDTNPLNNLFKTLGDAIDMDMSGLQMGPLVPPPPPPEAMQLQQMMQQAEAQKTQAEAQKASAEAQKLTMEAQTPGGEKMMELQLKAAESQQDMQAKAQEAQFGMALKQEELEMKKEEHELDMMFQAQKHEADLDMQRQQIQAAMLEQAVQLKAQTDQARHKMATAVTEHRLKMEMNRQKPKGDK